MDDLPPSIAFRLQGTKSNRDAIGAAVTVETSAGRQTRTLQAGSGFLSQHSKDIFFGLGEAREPVRASIRWPSGLVQELRNLPINHRIWVEEGLEPSRIEPFKTVVQPKSGIDVESQESELLPTNVETWLLAPVAAPDFSLADFSGSVRTLSTMRGKPALLHFWTTKSPGSQQELSALQKNHALWTAKGLQLISVNVDDPGDHQAAISAAGFSFPILRGSQDVSSIYNILYRQLFDRHRDLSLPTSFLINRDGEIVKVYQGPIVPDHVERDFQSIPRTDAERLARALPFPSANYTLEVGRNYLSLGALYFQRGYLDQAENSFQQALSGDPASAEALYGIGSVYLNQNKNSDARRDL